MVEGEVADGVKALAATTQPNFRMWPWVKFIQTILVRGWFLSGYSELISLSSKTNTSKFQIIRN